MSSTWQAALANCVTEPEELLSLLELDLSLLPHVSLSNKAFPLRVPRGFVARMQKGNPLDPLLLQVLPRHVEYQETPGYTKDALGEAAVNPIPGLLHKHHGRVLLTPTGACAINCRYCFRRHFPYTENNPTTAGWQKALEYISQDNSIEEVILSGGDPLAINDTMLKTLFEKLAAIPHVQYLRIHTRIPIVLPERITPEFIANLTMSRLKPVIIVHCNHPQEIDASVQRAMQQLRDAGVTLFNQSVLLKGINDNADTLVALSHALFAANILPYYINVLDKVQGAAHFDLSWATARKLQWEIMQRLPGYLTPRFVSEQPGAPAKIPLSVTEFCTAWIPA